MSDFLSGGQITTHKFRMFGQVAKLVSRLTVVVAIVSFGYSFYTDITPNEWKLGLVWLKKEVFSSIDPDKRIEYHGSYGQKHVTTARAFENDPYVRSVLRKFEVTYKKGVVTVIIMVSVVVGGVIIYFLARGRSLRATDKLRGSYLITEKELKKEIKKHNRQFDYKPFEIAGIPYPINGRSNSYIAGEQSHTFILGATNAGKTKIMQHLVWQLHQRNQKAIIVDMKGDYISHFYRPGDIILNPLDIRGSNWSIFNETNALIGFDTIAKTIVGQESKNDPFWYSAARRIFSELAKLYWNDNLSLNEFVDKILKTDVATLEKLLKPTIASHLVRSEAEKTTLCILMILSTSLFPLKLYRSNKECFSITEWIKDESKRNFLFVSSRADVKETLNPLVSTQVDIAINALRGLQTSSSVPKVWFIMDELPYFERGINRLKDGLATVRQYGGCFVLGTQDISSLEKIYGIDDTRSILNNCGTKLFMNVDGSHTGNWCSNALGDGEIEELHEGVSYGSHEMRDGVQVNRNKLMRRLVLPSEFTMLKVGQGYIKFPGRNPAKFHFEDFYLKTISDPFIENKELSQFLKAEIAKAQEERIKIEHALCNKDAYGAAKAKQTPAEEHDELSDIRDSSTHNKKHSLYLE